MKPTIRNKLVAGFAAVLALMAVVAGIGGYAVFSLRRSAFDATRVGARLNSIALEIQVHNLEAARKVKNYMGLAQSAGAQQKRDMYLEEARFEIHEIQSLTKTAIGIAKTPAIRGKFEAIAGAVSQYEQALGKTVEANRRARIALKPRQQRLTMKTSLRAWTTTHKMANLPEKTPASRPSRPLNAPAAGRWVW